MGQTERLDELQREVQELRERLALVLETMKQFNDHIKWLTERENRRNAT